MRAILNFYLIHFTWPYHTSNSAMYFFQDTGFTILPNILHMSCRLHFRTQKGKITILLALIWRCSGIWSDSVRSGTQCYKYCTNTINSQFLGGGVIDLLTFFN